MQDYQTFPTASDWDLTWVHFRPRQHWDKYLQWPVHENGLRYLVFAGDENQQDFVSALHGMLEFARRTLPVALDFAMAALEQALLWCHVAASHAGGVPSDTRVRFAADYLASHLGEPFNLEKLAAQCNLSVSRLSHLFKDHVGVTPQQFLEQHRMRHACHLLKLTGLSVAEVAREVGYEDPFYFSNRFRRSLGESPLRYRQNKPN
jgi:AraC family transcriptional regulator of arabinose operon